MTRRARTWLSQAENDLAHAKYAMEGGYYSHACYSAAQAAEKALKSLLMAAGAEVPFTHSILRLLAAVRTAGIWAEEDRIALADARRLTRMNIETRYPIADQDDAPFQLYGKEEAWQAVEACERILTFVRGLILRDEHSKGD